MNIPSFLYYKKTFRFNGLTCCEYRRKLIKAGMKEIDVNKIVFKKMKLVYKDYISNFDIDHDKDFKDILEKKYNQSFRKLTKEELSFVNSNLLDISNDLGVKGEKS